MRDIDEDLLSSLLLVKQKEAIDLDDACDDAHSYTEPDCLTGTATVSTRLQLQNAKQSKVPAGQFTTQAKDSAQ